MNWPELFFRWVFDQVIYPVAALFSKDEDATGEKPPDQEPLRR